MIGSIRKHSKWLWWVIAGLTIVSFVFFMGSGPARNRGGGGEGSFGTLYGHPVTGLEYKQAINDFDLFFWMNEQGRWPQKGTISELDLDKQVYLNLMFTMKAKSLGIAVSDQAAVTTAAGMLNSQVFNRNLGNRSGKAVGMDEFVSQVLKPQGLTAADFEHFIRSQMVREQLQMALGLPGTFVTPQEASASYDRDHATVSTEALFFSAPDYLDKVSATPSAVGEYFTNYMADYREPDRVQVNYVWFNLTNYLAQAKAEWAKTNFEETVTNVYLHADPSEFGDAKTPEAARAKIRDALIQRRALIDADQQARDLVTTLFAMDPVKLENLAAAAREKGLTAHLSEPFPQEGSEEFANVPDLAKAAFALTGDSPFSGEIQGGDGIYIIGLATNLPSSMPAFADIQAQVTKDFELQQATTLARTAGTNFWISASVQAAMGKTLAQIAMAKSLSPVTLAPFSLSSSDIPEIGTHAEPDTFKQVAFHVPPGHLSPLIPTRDGGFVVYVKSVAPPDAAAKTAELPQYTSQMRRERESVAFNVWVNSEAQKEFANIPALQKAMSASRQP
jgi:hypothetical protein